MTSPGSEGAAAEKNILALLAGYLNDHGLAEHVTVDAVHRKEFPRTTGQKFRQIENRVEIPTTSLTSALAARRRASKVSVLPPA